MNLIEVQLQGQVDAQLLEQGAYSALELLFTTGRLSYADYEAWRGGEVELLDSALMGDVDRIRRQLEAAAGYARGIGLVEQPQEFFAWQHAACGAARKLHISADIRLERLIAARFVPASCVPQLDLFFDNPVVALTSGIVQALIQRDATEAQRLLDRLYAQAPNHGDLASFDRLLEALSHLTSTIDDVSGELEFLLAVTPTARRLLGAQSRDLLAPLWRQLAAALEGHPFMSEQPALHRSHALSEAQDWLAVNECVLQQSQWWRHEVLCWRLAHSCRQQPRRLESLKAWCQLCWRVPELTARALDELPPDSALAVLWQRFADDEALQDGLVTDPLQWSAAQFPAWLLLHEASWSHQLPADLAVGDSPGEQQFQCVHQWLLARHAAQHQTEMALRRQLRASQPLLFAKLMHRVEPHRQALETRK